MKSKIFAVAAFAFAFAFAFSASAVTPAEIYTPASGFLRVGSGMGAKAYQMSNVMAAQTALNACLNTNIAVDGKYGPITAQTFKNFQISKSLKIDGVIGNETATALAACSGGTSTTPSTGSTTLSGGAGDLSYSSTSTGLKSDVKEGSEEKVLATKLEADGSDISISSIKVELQNNSGNGSTRLEKYIDEVVVMLGSKEVGSVDGDEFSKDGTNYSKSIALSSAVVKEDMKENLFVVVKTLSTVDDDTAEFDGVITQVRWMDATGAIFSDSDSDGSDYGTGAAKTFGFDEASVDDDISIKSSSSNPDAATLLVDADNESDEHLIGVFKLDVDEDSSDITVYEFPILVTFTASGNTTDDADADNAENIISEIRVTVDGEEFTATLEDSEVTNGAGTAVYVIDDEFTVDAGDVVDVKIYATFMEQEGNYASGQKIDVSTDENVNENTPDYSWSAEGEDELNVDGSFPGKTHTLSIDDATVDTFKWTVNSTGTIIDFFFTVEAGDEDFDVLAADIIESVVDDNSNIVNTSGTPETAEYGILSKFSGDSVTAIGSTGFTVASGDTTTFRVRYSLTGTNGEWTEVTITSVAGTTVPDDKETSPTATLNIN